MKEPDRVPDSVLAGEIEDTEYFNRETWRAVIARRLRWTEDELDRLNGETRTTRFVEITQPDNSAPESQHPHVKMCPVEGRMFVGGVCPWCS